MQNANLVNLLKATPLFAGADEKRLAEASASCVLRDYVKGGEISSNDPSLYVVIRGSVRVYRTEGGQKVLLNTIKDGGVFGAAQLFCKDEAFSSVKAACACACLQMPASAVTRLLENDPVFTVNYVTFLSDRIRFLNKKIASLTAGTGEKTLADYLLSQYDGKNVIRLSQNVSSLAQSLNLSRPTLYRAFISLQNQGIIEKSGKEVKIISENKLKSV